MNVITETGITTKRGKRTVNQDAFFHDAQLLTIRSIDKYEFLAEHLKAFKSKLISGIRRDFSYHLLLKEEPIRCLMNQFPVIYSFMEHLPTLNQERDKLGTLNAVEGFLQDCSDLPLYVRWYGVPIKSRHLDSVESAINAYPTIHAEGSHEIFTKVFQELDSDREVAKFRDADLDTPEELRLLERLREALSSRGRLFAVADGVSGAQEGHIAAQLSTRMLRSYYESGKHVTSGLACGDILTETIREIDQQLAEMDIVTATALTAVLIEARNENDLQCQAFWVGDVEAYLMKDKTQVEPELLTGGHGELRPEKANANPVRYLGTPYGACVHKSETKKLKVGNLIIIASDGVTRYLSRKDIASAIADSPNPQDASQQIVEKADHKSTDNLTAMVIRIDKIHKTQNL